MELKQKKKEFTWDKKLTLEKKGVPLGSATVTIANPKASLP